MSNIAPRLSRVIEGMDKGLDVYSFRGEVFTATSWLERLIAKYLLGGINTDKTAEKIAKLFEENLPALQKNGEQLERAKSALQSYQISAKLKENLPISNLLKTLQNEEQAPAPADSVAAAENTRFKEKCGEKLEALRNLMGSLKGKVSLDSHDVDNLIKATGILAQYRKLLRKQKERLEADGTFSPEKLSKEAIRHSYYLKRINALYKKVHTSKSTLSL